MTYNVFSGTLNLLNQSCLYVTLVYCGQTAGCIKISLGMEVGIDPGDFALHGDPVPPLPQKKGGAQLASLQFSPMSVVAKRLDGSRCHFVRRSASAKATKDGITDRN